MKQLKLFFCCLISIVSFTAYGQPQGGAQWEMVFSEHHLVGTFVLKHLETGNTKVYNPLRADSTYLPASTFKILREEGIIDVLCK